MRIKFLYSVLLASFCVLTPSLTRAGDTLRVLFIGNSYTFVNDLPSMVGNMAVAGGDKLITASSTPGGATLEQHCNNPATLGLINQGNWDYVVLQEQSQLPSFPEGQVQFDFYPFAKKLDSLVKLKNTCAKTVFYMTWGRKNGDAANCGFFPPLCTYLGMDSMLQLRYTIAADTNHAVISPVARVWRKLRNANPGIELYDADESHPSLAGTYAAACSFYSIFFKKNPALVNFNPGLGSSDYNTIKTAAKAVVYDSLAYWYRFYPSLKAGFTYTTTGASVTFANTSKNGLKYLWLFGDGQLDSTKNPTHTYKKSGSFQVKLIVQKCADNDTFKANINIASTAIPDVADQEFLEFSPNPARQFIHIKVAGLISRFELYDGVGKRILQGNANRTHSLSLSTEKLPDGLYYLRVQTDRGVFNRSVSVLR
ncbi:MAG: PKD domain-containing protein [Bacteroidetes bacterium]|nr:PKD domain-containing protein [Bacteroidota bacterium]